MSRDVEKWKTMQLAIRGGWGTTARYVVIRIVPTVVVGLATTVVILAKFAWS